MVHMVRAVAAEVSCADEHARVRAGKSARAHLSPLSPRCVRYITVLASSLPATMSTPNAKDRPAIVLSPVLDSDHDALARCHLLAMEGNPLYDRLYPKERRPEWEQRVGTSRSASLFLSVYTGT